MAIYHLSAQIIGRSDGRSSVAAAAYRAKEKIVDERTGLVHDYTKRQMEIESEIIAPPNVPDWVYQRQKLWNEVESIEKRKDAQLAREINIALPKELSKEQNRELIKEYATDNFVNRGMIADVAIHWEKDNPHAHIMLTTRDITPDGFDKKNREWNDKDLLESWRESWARSANQALAQANAHEHISHKTLKEQGIDREPQIHLGPAVISMEKKGLTTERGEIHRQIGEVNKKIIEIEEYKRQKEELINAEKSLGLGYDLNEEEKNQLKPVREYIQAYGFSRDAVLKEIKRVKETEENIKKDLGEASSRLSSEINLKTQMERLQDIEGKMKHYSLGHKIVNWKDYKALKEKAKSQKKDIQELCKEKKIPSLEAVSKVITEVRSEKACLENALEKIDSRKSELIKAIKVMEEAERRHILKDYPEEMQGMDYKGAIKLKLYSLKYGKVADYKDIYRHYEKVDKEYRNLEKWIETIQNKDSCIKVAEEKLDNYLRDKKELEKLKGTIFKFGQKYKDREEEANHNCTYSESIYRDYEKQIGERFSTKKELEEIKNRHQIEVNKIPELKERLEQMKPVLAFMESLTGDVNSSVNKNLDDVLERAKQKVREETNTKNKSHSRGWDMER